MYSGEYACGRQLNEETSAPVLMLHSDEYLSDDGRLCPLFLLFRFLSLSYANALLFTFCMRLVTPQRKIAADPVDLRGNVLNIIGSRR